MIDVALHKLEPCLWEATMAGNQLSSGKAFAGEVQESRNSMHHYPEVSSWSPEQILEFECSPTSARIDRAVHIDCNKEPL